MFYGRENRILDSKGRLSFSRRVIEELGEKPIITKRGDRIRVYPQDAKNKFKPHQIFEARIDKERRLQISRKLFLWQKVIVIGNGDCLEIRPRKKNSLRRRQKGGEAGMKDFHFRHAGDGCWDFLIRSRPSSFLTIRKMVRKGRIDAIDASTLAADEEAQIHGEGFNLVPDEIFVGIGSARRLIKVLKIERS